jgi:hypothetical protein
MHRAKIQRKKMMVNTVVLAAPPKVTITPASAPAPTSSPPKKPVAKQQAKKQSPPTAPVKKIEQALLQEIEQSLGSLSKIDPSPKKSNIVVPTLTLQLQEQKEEYTGRDIIASILQSELELPEYGEVKIKLLIGKSGTLDDLEILEARSQKNAEFLKKRLPELSFPCLNEVTTLTIVFSNAL